MDSGMSAPTYHLTIRCEIEVLDPNAVLASPSAMCMDLTQDGHLEVYLPASVAEGLVSRFTALLDGLMVPHDGLKVLSHQEDLQEWHS